MMKLKPKRKVIFEFDNFRIVRVRYGKGKGATEYHIEARAHDAMVKDKWDAVECVNSKWEAVKFIYGLFKHFDIGRM
jgi:hypothetical protein